jgi:hypothetical protein
MKNPSAELLSTKEAIAWLKTGGVWVTAHALAQLRCDKRPPKFVKIDGRVFYKETDLKKFGRYAFLRRRTIVCSTISTD